MRAATPLLLVLLLACGDSPVGAPGDATGDPGPGGDGPGPRTGRIPFIVNHVHGMNASEHAIEDRVEALTGLSVEPITDEEFVEADTVGCRMILLSKTADDAIIRDRIKEAPCGILFWEENEQTLQDLATVVSHGEDLAFWHDPGSRVWVRPEAPAALRAGLSGEVELYVPLDSLVDVSYGKWEHMRGTAATIVAELDRPGYHKAIYYYDRGDTLADGTVAAARRLFFGLHRDTYRHLSDAGRDLFDVAVLWTVGED